MFYKANPNNAEESSKQTNVFAQTATNHDSNPKAKRLFGSNFQ